MSHSTEVPIYNVGRKSQKEGERCERKCKAEVTEGGDGNGRGQFAFLKLGFTGILGLQSKFVQEQGGEHIKRVSNFHSKGCLSRDSGSEPSELEGCGQGRE